MKMTNFLAFSILTKHDVPVIGAPIAAFLYEFACTYFYKKSFYKHLVIDSLKIKKLLELQRKT